MKNMMIFNFILEYKEIDIQQKNYVVYHRWDTEIQEVKMLYP